MPSTLDPGDRKLLLIAGSLLLLLIFATIAFAPPPNDAEGQGVPSTYSTANNGAQAAYLLLQELGYRSQRWEKSSNRIALNPQGQILILAGPSNFPEKAEREALLRFARSGGWIIYAGNLPFLFLESGAVTSPALRRSNLTGEQFQALAPSPFTRGVSADHTVREQSLGHFRRHPGPTLWGERRAGRGHLATGKGAHPLVGCPHSANQFRDFATRQPGILFELHSGRAARRCSGADDGSLG